MRYLIIIRRGDPQKYPGRGISDVGKRQMHVLAEKLRNYVEGDTAILLSSSKQRARESSDIIADKLGLTVHIREELASDFFVAGEELLALAQKEGGERRSVLVFTHVEQAHDILLTVFRQNRGKRMPFFSNFSRGCAYIVDCEAPEESQFIESEA